jgi:hypothetical protein
MDFSGEALLRVQLVLQGFEDVKEELDPHGDFDEDNAAEMNITFFLYVIKDALEYCGLYPKTSPAREIKNALLKFDVLQARSEEIAKLLSQLEQE